MFDKFRDYLYYLLPTPFKKLKKELNQWYIFLSVIGDEYDKVQAELERALEETAVATCSDSLLEYYAQEREMYRYPNESNDTYRSRIAMRDEVEALGGTKQAILLAAKTLGFIDAEHIWLPDLGYSDKWSQFLLRVTVNGVQDFPTDIETLKAEVRKAKDSTSLDNYCLSNVIHGRVFFGAGISIRAITEIGD